MPAGRSRGLLDATDASPFHVAQDCEIKFGWAVVPVGSGTAGGSAGFKLREEAALRDIEDLLTGGIPARNSAHGGPEVTTLDAFAFEELFFVSGEDSEAAELTDGFVGGDAAQVDG